MKEIIFLEPVFTHNIWGGEQLKTKFGYEIPGDDIGECWGISAHNQGDCKIAKGTYKGNTLSQLYKEHGELFGQTQGEIFPLLVKIIDAKNDLSIQVHPDDAYAKINENGSFGKTECWYILDCPDNADLVVGHNANSKKELSDMINNNKWEDFLRKIPIQKGDFIQIDPGTVHAITGGCLVLETQQNSNITYRVYDYNRKSNGVPRELHIQKSLDVITVPAKSVDDSVKHYEHIQKNQLVQMEKSKYYEVFKADIDNELIFTQSYNFMNISVIDGKGTINDIAIQKGDHFILPYEYGDVAIQGELSIITSVI